MDRIFLPTDRIFLPTDRIFLPTDCIFLPTDRIFLPTDRIFLPTDRIFVPTLNHQQAMPRTVSVRPRSGGPAYEYCLYDLARSIYRRHYRR